jgi:hypothetical protein
MTENRLPDDMERAIVRSLHAAAPVPTPDIVERVLLLTSQVPQRRPWRLVGFAPLAAVAAVAVLAVAFGLGIGQLLGPSGTGEPRSDEPSPSPTVAPTESPTAQPSRSSTPSPSEAASVFPNGSRCENVALGYAVSYPAEWHANEEVRPDDQALDPIPACQYFGEEPMELMPNAGLPPSVAISFDLEAAATPPGGEVIRSEQVTVAGRPAELREVEGTGDGAFIGEGDRVYEYLVELPSSEVLIVSTDSTRTGDYEAHRDVLDLMMQTLVLAGG